MTYFVYKDRQNLWRWQLKSSNGKILADSGESYYNKQDCLHCIQLVSSSGQARVIEV